jgi:hypothetical protein
MRHFKLLVVRVAVGGSVDIAQDKNRKLYYVKTVISNALRKRFLIESRQTIHN